MKNPVEQLRALRSLFSRIWTRAVSAAGVVGAAVLSVCILVLFGIGAGLWFIAIQLWRPEAVLVLSVAIYTAGIAAMYGDDYIVAASLYLAALIYSVAKLVAWEETRRHRNKTAISILLVAAGIAAFVGSMVWIRHRSYEVAAGGVWCNCALDWLVPVRTTELTWTVRPIPAPQLQTPLKGTPSRRAAPAVEASVGIGVAVGNDNVRDSVYMMDANNKRWNWMDDVHNCVLPMRCFADSELSHPVEVVTGQKGWARVIFLVFNTSTEAIPRPTVGVGTLDKVKIGKAEQRPGGQIVEFQSPTNVDLIPYTQSQGGYDFAIDVTPNSGTTDFALVFRIFSTNLRSRILNVKFRVVPELTTPQSWAPSGRWTHWTHVDTFSGLGSPAFRAIGRADLFVISKAIQRGYRAHLPRSQAAGGGYKRGLQCPEGA